jgi:hypothetical protein
MIDPSEIPVRQADPPIQHVVETASRRGWRIYAFFLTAALFLSYGTAAATDFKPILVLDVVSSVLGISGLFGYAYRKRVFRRRFWAWCALLLPTWDLVLNFLLYRPHGYEPAISAVGVLLFVPEYVALWRYARSSPEIWNAPADPAAG